MEKSFYYMVPVKAARRIEMKLRVNNIPYLLEIIRENKEQNHEIGFVFPSLPIRLYAVVRKLLGGDGKRYHFDND